MNNDRRTQLTSAIAELSAIKDQLEQIRLNIESVKDDEQEARDNLPESLQDSARAAIMDEAIFQLEDAANNIETIDLDDIIYCIEIAKE